jgi:hypothetical protein
MLRELSIVKGWPDTAATLRAWVRRPLHVLLPWIAVSMSIALALLLLTWWVGSISPPATERPHDLPSMQLVDHDSEWRRVFRNNLTVLALHAAACFAGFVIFIARTDPSDGESIHLERLTRWTARAAVLFVPFATLLSIGTQAWVLGTHAVTLSYWLHVTLRGLLGSTIGHSMPELAAIFLPLAAFMVTTVRRRPQELLAATLVSVAIAVPVIAYAATVEVERWPGRLVQARAEHPIFDGVRFGFLVSPNATIDAVPASDQLDAIEVRLQDRVGDTTWRTGSAAVDDMRGARSRKHAVAIMETPDGFVAHELWGAVRQADCTPTLRRRLDRPARPLDLQAVAHFHLLELPGDAGPSFHALVQDDLVLTREQLDDWPGTGRGCAPDAPHAAAPPDEPADR